jgi:chromatin assembly factor 1 subunit A
MFPPFFLKEHVTLAPYNQFQQERWGSQNLEEDLDNYISNVSERPYTLQLDPSSLFNCPDLTLHVRGKEITPVRQIMDTALGRTGKPADSTTDSQNTQIKRTKKLLQSIPYKIISFSQDVRPPYCGTRTRHGLATLQKLARHPCKPELEDLNYDYDSEAEWIENDEDEGGAEDLMSNGSDDEDDDDEGDGDEFIDDADADNVKRALLPADQEPRSTGLCWEDGCRKGPNLELDSYRMEVMNGKWSKSISILDEGY